MQATSSTPAARGEAKEDVAALAEDLNAFIAFVHRASGHRFFAMAEELDLSLTQVKALHRLDVEADEMSVKQLGEALGLSLPAASRTVEGLLGRGLLVRREDDQDRRVRRVAITTAGRETVVQLNRERVADLEKFVTTLAARERRQVRQALRPLLARQDAGACLRAPDSPASPPKEP